MTSPLRDTTITQCQLLANQNRNYVFKPNNNVPNCYNSNLWNHECFLFPNQKNVSNPLSRFLKPTEEKPPFEKLISSFVVETR